MSAALRRFKYGAIDATGARVSDEILASDRAAAIEKIAEAGLTIHQLKETRVSAPRLLRRRVPELEQKVFALRQMAAMAGAGVELLECFEVIVEVTPPSRIRDGFADCAAAIRRGESVSRAFSHHVKGYPAYVYALMRAGDASGQFAELMDVAAHEVAYENRIRQDVANALTYPLFLLCAGALVLGILFYSVVPEFARMLGPNPELGAIESVVFAIGGAVREHGVLILLTLGSLVLGAVAICRSSAAARALLIDMAAGVPIMKSVLEARWRMNWARILGVSLKSGIEILQAADLAETAVGGVLNRRMAQARDKLRNGASVYAAFSGAVDPIDAGLLKVGQKTGTLSAMFGHIAQRHEALFRNDIRRFTALLEPAAIGVIAMAIGVVAVSLVSSMTTLYEVVG